MTALWYATLSVSFRKPVFITLTILSAVHLLVFLALLQQVSYSSLAVQWTGIEASVYLLVAVKPRENKVFILFYLGFCLHKYPLCPTLTSTCTIKLNHFLIKCEEKHWKQGAWMSSEYLLACVA